MKWPPPRMGGAGKSGSIPTQDSLNNAGSRLALLIRKRGNRSTGGFNFLPAYDFSKPPVATLDENMRQNGLNQGQWRRFIKHRYVTDAFQSRQKQAAFECTQDRPLRSFYFSDRSVAVNSNHQGVAQTACILKITYVPRMQNIETAVGEDNPLPCSFQLLNPLDQSISF